MSMAMAQSSIPKLIWVSIKPFIKVLLPTLVGGVMVKCKKLDQHGLKAAAHIMIFAALPCLIFSNIVPSINPQNSPRILVCVGFALFYMAMSYLLSKALLLSVAVPRNFRSGFVVAAVWSNWGNIPISVIQSLTAEPPFGNPADADLAISFASFFVMVYNVMMFVGPGTSMIDQDYQVEEEKIGSLRDNDDDRNSPHFNREESRQEERASLFGSPEIGSDIGFLQDPQRTQSACLRRSTLRRFLNHLSPVNIALILGMLIALTEPLKDMFVTSYEGKVPKFTTPDGKPLFAVILDSADYLGAAAIPLGLLITGASFASMSITRRTWSRLPMRAIFSMAALKLICLPALGIVMASLIDTFTDFFSGQDGRLLKLVCLYYSCTVTSTNQIFLSAIAAVNMSKAEEHDLDEEMVSNVDLLCAFIALQYILYPIVGTIFIGILLQLVS